MSPLPARLMIEKLDCASVAPPNETVSAPAPMKHGTLMPDAPKNRSDVISQQTFAAPGRRLKDPPDEPER